MNDPNKPIYKVLCEQLEMAWFILFTGLAFIFVRYRRAQRTELEPTGIYRSPLYWSANALVLLLLALVMYMAHIHHQMPIPAFLWFAVLTIVVALLVLRRTLKWRYPL